MSPTESKIHFLTSPDPADPENFDLQPLEDKQAAERDFTHLSVASFVRTEDILTAGDDELRRLFFTSACDGELHPYVGWSVRLDGDVPPTCPRCAVMWDEYWSRPGHEASPPFPTDAHSPSVPSPRPVARTSVERNGEGVNGGHENDT